MEQQFRVVIHGSFRKYFAEIARIHKLFSDAGMQGASEKKQRIFEGSKSVVLNEEAEEYVWMPARPALRDLDIEPNARYTVELYAKLCG